MGTKHGLAWVDDKSRNYKCDDAKPSERLVLVIFDIVIIGMEESQVFTSATLSNIKLFMACL